MTGGRQLDRAFEHVRTRYFPRWDRGRRWTVVVGSHTGSDLELAFCHRQTKTIFVSAEVIDGVYDLGAILVHEIVHAVVGDGHGQAFVRRVRAALEQAVAVGDHKLATKLAQDIEQIHERRPITAADVYRLVAVYADSVGRPSYAGLVQAMKHLLGLCQEELERKYRRLPAVFEAELRSPPLPRVGVRDQTLGQFGGAFRRWGQSRPENPRAAGR